MNRGERWNLDLLAASFHQGNRCKERSMRFSWNTPSRMEFYTVVALALAALGLSHSLGYWPYGIPVQETSKTVSSGESWVNREDIWRVVFVLTLLAVGYFYYLGRKAGVLVNPGLPPEFKKTNDKDGHESLMPFNAISTTLPDGREIHSCTPEDLRSVYRDNTLDQTNRLLIGKWVKLSSRIDNNHGGGKVYLEKGRPLILLHFDNVWFDQLATLGRGSSVTVRGQIAPSEIFGMNIQNCELL